MRALACALALLCAVLTAPPAGASAPAETPSHAAPYPALKPSPLNAAMTGLKLSQHEEDKAMSDAAQDLPPALPASPPPSSPEEAENRILQEIQAVEVAPVAAVPPLPPDDGTGEEKPKIVEKQGAAGKITYVERPEDSLLLLELALHDRVTVLDDAFEGYLIHEETLIVPLGKLAKLLDFPIAVDTGAGAAKGWFIRPENTFSLEQPYRQAVIGGKQIPIARGIAETHLDDIYVSIDLLATWFPVELTLNYNELRLYLKPLVDLPFQERAQRQARWKALERAKALQPGLDYDPKEVIRLPYRMYAAPSVQVLHGLNHNIAPDGGSTTATSHSVNMQGDLLGMSARASGTFQTSTAGQEQLQGLNFNMLKEDYQGGLLGPLHATRYELGDVATGPFPLAGQQTGRGAILTNEPYNFVRDPTNFRIRGFAPAGWDVEVFQDDQLLAFGPVAPDGRYDFAALPLGEGFNLFRIVLYGPNGERETRYERFYLGQDMVKKGDFLYNVALLQSSTPLIDVSASPPPETPHTVSLLGEYGVTDSISATGGYYRGPMGTAVLDGAGFGLRASGGSAYAQLNSFFDKSGGQSTGALVTGNLTPTTSFNAQHTFHRGYDPGVYTTPKRTSVQASKLFDFRNEIIPDINVTMQGAREVADTGRVKKTLLNRLSTNFLGLALTNELERSFFSDATPDIHDGRFSGRYRAPFGTLRADVNYQYRNPFRVQSAGLNLQTDIAENLTLSAGLGRTFGAAPVTTFTGSLDWKLDRVRVGLAGTIDSLHAKQIGVTLAYNLVPQSITGDYALSGLTDDVNSGRLLLRPFVDQNGDGVWQPGEPLVEDVEFRNQLRGQKSKPVADGLGLLGGLSPNLANPVTVEEKSLLDFTLTPVRKRLLVLGKTGVNGPLDFPFRKSGSISGTILRKGPDGEDKPVENVRIILLDAQGKEVTDTWSEYDGYFAFEDIALGAYELFFAASADLQQYYKGSGDGPGLTLTYENAELHDLRLRVEPDAIILENPPAQKSE